MFRSLSEGTLVQYGPPVDPNNVEPGNGFSQPLPLREDDIYFYHSDHLGSTSYVTDADANPTQFVCYLPFGQAFVDEHTTRPEMPYKFNGKEQDAETGVLYYGARYYDPNICVWYGVDPLAERHYDWSPYVYVLNNPLSNIDLYGYTDWKAVGRGVAVTTGGILGTISGVGLAMTPTGAGQIAGAGLISLGIPSVGLGMGIIIEGFQDKGRSEGIPGGVNEAVGMMVDKHKGDGSNTYRKVGALVDLGVNISGGTSTLTEKVVVGALAIDFFDSVTSSDNSQRTNGLETEKSVVRIDNTRVVSTNSSKHAIKFTEDQPMDESLVKEFFNR